MDLNEKMDVIDFNSEIRRLKIEPRPGERVFEIIPKHMGKVLAPISITAVLTVFFFVILFSFANSTLYSPATYLALSLFIGAIYLGLVAYSISQWYAFRLSALIFTNQRIIDSDWRTMFSRIIRELDVRAIKNAQGSESVGLGTILNYGSLIIDRIGQEPVTVTNIPYPQIVAEQTLHFHNLIAHGGIDTAHNYQAFNIKDDETPELESVIEQAEKIAEQQHIPVSEEPDGSHAEQPPPEEQEQRQSSPLPEAEPKPVSAPAKQPSQSQAQPQSQPEQPPEKQLSPVDGSQTDIKSAAIISVKTPPEKVAEVLKELPAEERTVNYLDQDDMFEVEAVVTQDEAEEAKKVIEEKGINRPPSPPQQ